jgi:hypothetical protein
MKGFDIDLRRYWLLIIVAVACTVFLQYAVLSMLLRTSSVPYANLLILLAVLAITLGSIWGGIAIKLPTTRRKRWIAFLGPFGVFQLCGGVILLSWVAGAMLLVWFVGAMLVVLELVWIVVIILDRRNEKNPRRHTSNGT